MSAVFKHQHTQNKTKQSTVLKPGSEKTPAHLTLTVTERKFYGTVVSSKLTPSACIRCSHYRHVHRREEKMARVKLG